ncbi:tetratricopeptide repeat protein [Labrys okinawensis]|nr:tetratricopeptide repeat protein [Labrys okinawensis]
MKRMIEQDTKAADSGQAIDQVLALAGDGRTQDALALLTLPVAAVPRNRNQVRRLVVAPAMRAGELDTARIFLERLVEANPSSSDDLLTLGSVMMRSGRREAGQAHIDRAGELDPDNLAIAAVRLQALVQGTDFDAARDFARRYADRSPDHARLAQLCLIALARAGDLDTSLVIVEQLQDRADLTADLALEVAQVLQLAGRHEQALAIGRKALDQGGEAPRLHLVVANAMLSLGGDDAEILEHLRQARDKAAKDVLLLRTLGETLLRLRQNEEAVDVLRQASELAPDLRNLKMLLARALRLARHYDEAATLLRKLAQEDPHSPALQRYTISTLLQAGLKDEAQGHYADLVGRKRAYLQGSFADALARLDENLANAPIPKGRLDFAWSLASRLAGREPMDRKAWDDRARWGCLADLLLLDWLECAPERAGEVAAMLDGIDAAVAGIRKGLDKGKGALLISPHMGPMYAGPLALHMAGIPMKWLASAPKIASFPHVGSLISTSEHSELEVTREVMTSLRQGNAVVIAIDGAMSPAAPRVGWEGRQVTYSQFAGGLCYRLGVPSFITIPYWQDRRVKFHVEAMPAKQEGQEFPAFAQAYQDAFFHEVERQILRGPENLRLSGGIWRGIR